MIDFTYQSPTKLVFGESSFSEIGPSCKKYGTKVLLHYGKESVKKYGVYDKVIKELQKHSISFVELSGVIPNPSVNLVYEGIELCKKENVDFILALGGGSVIDSAKAIAMGVFYDGDVWDFFTKGLTPEKALPIGSILTIPAAGSESSNAVVITNYEAKLKRSCRHELLRPKFAILNPTVTYTLPAYQTAVGVVDMIGHVIERYFTNTRHVELIDRLAEGHMKTVIEQVFLCLDEPENYDARAQLMLASTIAHNGWLGLGREEDWACHLMEYEVTQKTGIAHGHGLAILYPAWMRYVLEHDIERFALFAKSVFDIPSEGDLYKQAKRGIDALEAFYHSLGLSTRLSQIGISESDLPKMAKTVTNNNAKTIGHFVPLNYDDVLNIYKLAL